MCVCDLGLYLFGYFIAFWPVVLVVFNIKEIFILIITLCLVANTTIQWRHTFVCVCVYLTINTLIQQYSDSLRVVLHSLWHVTDTFGVSLLGCVCLYRRSFQWDLCVWSCLCVKRSSLLDLCMCVLTWSADYNIYEKIIEHLFWLNKKLGHLFWLIKNLDVLFWSIKKLGLFILIN